MTYCILSKHQFGFRANHSTELAVSDIYEKLLYNLDKSLSTCTIFLDLAKAFDSVNHSILLRKLEKYGVRGVALKLFSSYLSGRSQFVKVNGVKSSLEEILFGVPQGSILGPLLFLIFINDLPDATSLYVKLFADDTFLCAQNQNIQMLQSEVNNELYKVAQWLSSNKLTLNIKKSKYMIISNKRNIPKLSININQSHLEECNEYKYLGVIIDKKLNWDKHIEHITQKISKVCGAMARLRHCVNFEVLKNVYYALVHSYIRYGIIVWGNASQSSLKPLQTAVNKVLRIMTFAPFGNIDLQPMYDFVKVLDVNKTFSLETGKFMYKQENLLIAPQIGGYFETDPYVNQHGYGLRSRSLNIPTRIVRRTKSSEKSLQIRGKKLIDCLPVEIKNAESFGIFKKMYKTFLLENNEE